MNTHKIIKSIAAALVVVLAMVFVVRSFNPSKESDASKLAETKNVPVLKNVPELDQTRTAKYSKMDGSGWPILSTDTSDEEIKNCQIFAVPLIATSEVNQADNNALAALVVSLRELDPKQRHAQIKDWLQRYPQSRWADSLRYQQATYRFSRGYFPEASEQMHSLWTNLKNEPTGTGAHTLANEVAAKLLDANFSATKVDQLRTLVEQLEEREINGVINGKCIRAKEAIWYLEHSGAESVLCGPLALNAIAHNLGKTYKVPFLGQITPDYIETGLPLSELAVFAKNNYGLEPLAVQRKDSGAAIPVPSVAHLKDDHYYAVLERSESGDAYFIEDRTLAFTGWVDREAIEQNASGHFLLTTNTLPEGYAELSLDSARNVFGSHQGHVFADPSQSTTDDDGCTNTNGGKKNNCGMPGYFFHTMPASLKITDIPLSYSPAIGDEVSFRLVFNPMDTSAPASAPSFANVGQNWSVDWVAWVDVPYGQLTTNSQLSIHRPGGGRQVTKFTESEDGTSIRPLPFPKNYSSTAVESIGYTTTYPNGSKLVYNVPNSPSYPTRYFLGEKIDGLGNKTIFSYDSATRLTQVTDAVGQVTTVRYEHPTDMYKITSVEDPFGRTAILEYNSKGQLVAITDQIDLRSSFQYDSNGDVVHLSTPYGVTTFEQGGDPVSATGRYVQATDPLGQIERAVYIDHSSAYAPTLINEHPISTVVNGASVILGDGPETSLKFRNSFYWDKEAWHHNPNDFGAAEITHWFTSSDWSAIPYAAGRKKPFEDWVWYRYPEVVDTNDHLNLDSASTPTKTFRMLDALTVRLSQAEYNELGMVTKSIDPLGRTTEIEYATNMVDVLEVHQVTDHATGARDLLSSATYNANHQPLTSTDAAGRTNTYTYNALGQILTVTDSANRTVTFTYENHLLKHVDGPLAGTQDRSTYTYDALARLQTSTTPEGYTLTYAYDDFDRVTRVTFPDTTYIENTYDRLDLVKVRDRRGRSSSYTYDALQRLRATQDPKNLITQYAWCRCGDMKELIDPKGQKTQWLYDIQGRLQTKTYADSSTETYTYDPSSGELKTSTNRKGDITTLTYNLDGSTQNVGYTDVDPNGPQTPGVSFLYEPYYARLKSFTDGIGTTQYNYYPTVSGTNGAGALHTIDGPWANDTVTYTYDSLGRSSSKSINGVDYGSNYSFDALDRVQSFTDALGNYGFTYEGVSGRMLTSTLPNNVVTSYDYGTLAQDFRLQEIHHKDPSNNTISKFNYTHTNDGRTESWTRQFGNAAPSSYQYGYDALDQLTSAVLTHNNVIQQHYSYSYDTAGNRTSKQQGSYVQAATHNNLNQLQDLTAGGATRFYGTVDKPSNVTVDGQQAKIDAGNRFEAFLDLAPGNHSVDIVATDGNGAQTSQTYNVDIDTAPAETLTFDSAGNTRTKTVGGQMTSYEWDALNRLLAVETSTTRSEFVYNGMSQRVGRKEYTGYSSNWTLSEDVKYLWSGGYQPSQERDSTGTTVTRHHLAGGFADDIGGTLTKYYTTRDHLGSIREVVDSSGLLETRYDYSPYGEVEILSSVNNVESTFLYTGHLYHEASNLNLTLYRAYDPSLGRWISADPIAESGGMNLYSYVFNDPINMLDPDGLKARGGRRGGGQGGIHGYPLTRQAHQNNYRNAQQRLKSQRHRRQMRQQSRALNPSSSQKTVCRRGRRRQKEMNNELQRAINPILRTTNTGRGPGNGGSRRTYTPTEAAEIAAQFLGHGYRINRSGEGISLNGRRKVRWPTRKKGERAGTNQECQMNLHQVNRNGTNVSNWHISIIQQVPITTHIIQAR